MINNIYVIKLSGPNNLIFVIKELIIKLTLQITNVHNPRASPLKL